MNYELGKLGERIAKDYLENKGYKVLEQNCKNKYGEIDLVAENQNGIVFVEVKTRREEQFGRPEDSLKRKKINRLIRNAQAYMAWRAEPKPYRIDAICIVLEKETEVKRIDHYQNITCRS